MRASMIAQTVPRSRDALNASKWREAASNLSRQPVLQNPTTWPRYRVSESACPTKGKSH